MNYKGKNIKTFLFHRVSPEKDEIWPPMSPYLFEEIIKHLNKKYDFVQLENNIVNDEKYSHRKPICAIVFDDGYRDFLNYALPILKKYNCPSSMYVVTNSVYNNIPPWTYVINYLFSNTNRNYLELDSSFIPESLKKISWSNDIQKYSVVKKLSPFLKTVINIERTSIYDQIVDQFNDVELPYGKMLSWKEINSLITDGVEIGSHSVSHPVLSQALYSSRIEYELSQSAKIIQKETGKFPIAISYPFGDCDYRVMKLAQKTGYKIGLGVTNKLENIDYENVFNIPRVELYNESLWKSKLRISGTLQKVKSFFGINKSQLENY